MKTVIVESISGYNYAKELLYEDDITWLSSSPAVLFYLSENNINHSSIENDVSYKTCNSIGYASHEIAKEISILLDENCLWRRYITFMPTLGLAVSNLFNVILYKGLLLDNTLSQSNDVICVGDSSISSVDVLNLGVKRFDTLFAVLAKKNSDNRLKIIEYKGEKEKCYKLDKWVKDRPMVMSEKVLSLINNTPSSFFYKLWRWLERNGVMKSVRFTTNPKHTTFIYKDCELIEEKFLSLLLKRVNIRRLTLLPRDGESLSIDTKELYFLKEDVKNICFNIIKKHAISTGGSIDAAIDLSIDRVFDVVSNIKHNIEDYTLGFEKVISNIKTKDQIITNFFSSPVDRMFAQYCLSNNIKTITFEHGITLGLSKWADTAAEFWGMTLGQTGVYHWPISIDSIKPWAGQHRMIIGGIPHVMKKINFPIMQRLIVRRLLNISSASHIVMFVAGAERNNYFYGPHSENDLNYMRDTKSIIKHLVELYPSSCILLKLYPTYRYPERYNFQDLTTKYNIKIISDMDFRFIRSAADVIATSSLQSTLGWVLGSNSKIILYEQKATPGYVAGDIMPDEVPGIRRIMSINHGFVNQKIKRNT